MSTEFRPYALQVGGHHHLGAAPASLLDAQGRFLKKLQAGDRGAREVAFYASVEQHRLPPAQGQQQQQLPPCQLSKQEGQTACTAVQPDTAAAAAAASAVSSCSAAASACRACGSGLQHSLMQQLSCWVPLSYGVETVGDEQYLVLQDLTAGYNQPCVLDVKVGFTTSYPWASEEQQAKYRSKDNSTTQATLGFRLCGMMVQQAAATGATGPSSSSSSSSGDGGGDSSCCAVRRDRHWGKQLTAEAVPAALRSFADNGHLNLRQLCHGPTGLVSQLQCLEDIFTQQQLWHFFSASLLVVYEGAAHSAEEARLAVRLIDFAHAFPVQQGQQQQQQPTAIESGPAAGVGPTGRDENFLQGLQSFVRVLEQACEECQV